MNLNYEKIKRKMEHGGDHWTSYSDLFLVLSVVFLLLYVIANIRAGTLSVAQQAQLNQAVAEADNLKSQIKAYEVEKDDYIKNGASDDEVKVYRNLMDHMDLLQKEAKDKRDEFNRQAREQDEKQRNLNQYQQLVKNIINANLVASGRVKKRDVMIEDRDKDIEGLNSTVQTQENEITQNNETIEKIQTNLQKQIQETRYAYRSKKNSKEKMEREITRLTDQSNEKIATLQEKSAQASAQLDQTRDKLAEKNREAERLMNTLSSKETQYQNSIASLKAAHEGQEERERLSFEKTMGELKLSADARVAQEKAFAEGLARKGEAYKAQLAGLNGELDKTRSGIKDIEGKYRKSMQSLMASDAKNEALKGQLAGLGGELNKARAGASEMEGKYKRNIASLEGSNKALSGDLAAAQRKLNEQRVLAENISKNFSKAGISASVDGKTGDVVINFQNEYFDTGSSDLKDGMKSILVKTFPVYAKSLMENPAIAKKIGSVEIIGFASPTYKGKAVDPGSLSTESRDAVNYNMDLSYQRAKAIFEHVFDTEKMQFKYQKEVLPMVKVSGRSYLATDKISGRGPANAGEDYCSVYDCKKSQRVIIKFNLKEE